MKKLEDYTKEEWENICTHCGKCCLIKLQDEDSGEVYYTDVICRYFDEEKCLCTVYDRRRELVPECLELNKDNVKNISWMPKPALTVACSKTVRRARKPPLEDAAFLKHWSGRKIWKIILLIGKIYERKA